MLMLARALRMDAGELVSAVDALIPKDWAIPNVQGMRPNKADQSEKKRKKTTKANANGLLPGYSATGALK